MPESPVTDRAEVRGPRKGKRWAVAALLAIILLVAALMVGPRVYSNFASSDEAAPTLAGETQDRTGGGSGSGERVDVTEGEWTVGPESYAGYRVDEILRGEPVTVVGRTQEVTGQASVAGEAVSDATIEVDMATVATDNGRRDAYFRDALDVEEHPVSTFTITEPIDLGAVGESPSTIDVSGDLTLGAETRPVTATLEVASRNGRLEVAGSVPITWADFGLDAPSLGFVEVEDSGAIEFLLHLAQ